MIEVVACPGLRWHVDLSHSPAAAEPALVEPILVVPALVEPALVEPALLKQALLKQVWAEMVAANPRLHDGPICQCLGYTAGSAASGGVLHVARSQFSAMAVQRDERVGDRGVRILGAKAMVVGRDSDGREQVIIGQRGPGVLMYPRQWELAPAGSIDAHLLKSSLDDALRQTVQGEGTEELDLDLPDLCKIVGPVCLYRDDAALCWDVIVRLDWRAVIDPRLSPGGCRVSEHSWEYGDVVWLARSDAAAWHARSPRALSPPTVSVLQWAGWI